MTGLTHKQNELLGFLEFFMAQSGGVSPSFDEMRAALDLKSKSGIHRLVSGLVERGLVRRLPNRARAIEIVTQRNPLSGFSTDDLVAELARRGIATRSHTDTTPPGLNLPEPRTEPPVSGSGPSVHSSFHAAEIANV